MSKVRVDVLMVERNLAETREKAKRLIMAGIVFSLQERIDKPGMKVSDTLPLTLKGKGSPYVGRGGFKLEKALNHFHLKLTDRIMVDVGASTGGFTDCALQNGAKKCYAIDVGYNQLDWKLRSDSRVIVMERTNFRYVTKEMFNQDSLKFATVDVSFISLKLILPVLKEILASGSDIVVLIKPQFEAGKEQVGKKGVVRDPAIHLEVLKKITTFANEQGFLLLDLTYSPITGGEGNIEFLAHFSWQEQDVDHSSIDNDLLKDVIKQAYQEFKK